MGRHCSSRFTKQRSGVQIVGITNVISDCQQGEWECLAQHPVSAFKSCEIKTMSHRKQSPSLPTLLLELKPDSISDKQRKRRSSRTGGLSSSKDPLANVLMFRSVAEERFNIFDWQMNLKPLLTQGEMEETPLSPLSPLSPAFASFTNPFATRRPSSSANRPELVHRSSGQGPINPFAMAPLQRDRPSALISPSPSLRSRRSDLSSQASSHHPPMGFTSSHPQTYATLPSDLPSPASTSTGYDNQFIEGWTSAQGRSSALSSHTRGSNSIASAVAPLIASTSPAPRETILDRAFQMRYIPGSDRVQHKDEEKISSIARFEALMREVDERKQARAVANQTLKKTQGWELDEESDESDNDEIFEEDDNAVADDAIDMPTPAQRALDYISGRSVLTPTPRAPPLPFYNSQAMSAFHGQSYTENIGGLRPGTSSSPRKQQRPTSLALPSRSISTTAVPTNRENGNNNLKAGGTDNKEKRRSSTSVKRLSFQEFAKRLSSTSSLLLVQTNASSSSGRDGSRRTSSEYGFEEEKSSLRGGAGPSSDKRCGWRNSVGVMGEGGFM